MRSAPIITGDIANRSDTGDPRDVEATRAHLQAAALSGTVTRLASAAAPSRAHPTGVPSAASVDQSIRQAIHATTPPAAAAAIEDVHDRRGEPPFQQGGVTPASHSFDESFGASSRFLREGFSPREWTPFPVSASTLSTLHRKHRLAPRSQCSTGFSAPCFAHDRHRSVTVGRESTAQTRRFSTRQ